MCSRVTPAGNDTALAVRSWAMSDTSCQQPQAMVATAKMPPRDRSTGLVRDDGRRISGASFQVAEHGEHPAVVTGGRREAELGEDAVDVLLDGAARDDQGLGDARVRAAFGHELQHLRLPGAERVERVGPAATGE